MDRLASEKFAKRASFREKRAKFDKKIARKSWMYIRAG